MRSACVNVGYPATAWLARQLAENEPGRAGLPSAMIYTALAVGASVQQRAEGGCYAVCSYGTVCDARTGTCVKETSKCGSACQSWELCVSYVGNGMNAGLRGDARYAAMRGRLAIRRAKAVSAG